MMMPHFVMVVAESGDEDESGLPTRSLEVLYGYAIHLIQASSVV